MSCLLHRSLRDAGHRLDEALETSEDWEFWLRLLPHARFATVPEPTHFYFLEAGTSGTGTGHNRHNRTNHLRFHDIVKARYAGERDRNWLAYFARLNTGIDLHRNRRIDDARAVYHDLLREFPDEPNALYLLGKTFQDTGQLHTARVLFRQAIYLNLDAGEYHFALGEVCEALGYSDEARDAYTSAARFAEPLRGVVAEHLTRLGPSAPAFAAAAGPAAAAAVSRNAPCPCGGGLRFKACHGRSAAGAAPASSSPINGSLGDLIRDALAAARAGDYKLATSTYDDVLAVAPDHVEALHARALLAWDMGDVAAAERGIGRAVQLAAHDDQILDNQTRIRVSTYERATARRVASELASLPFLVTDRDALAALPVGTPVHLVSPFENPYGGTEWHALEVARILGTRAPVTLWTTIAPLPAALAARGVRVVDPERGEFPRAGVVAFLGSWQAPPSWLKQCIPARVIVVHNADNPPALLDLVVALHDQTAQPVQLLMPSDAFRRRSGLPGVAYRAPIDLQRFRPPAVARTAARRFTIGRVSRNDHRKFHPYDPALFRRLAADGVAIRLLGGTILLRHFAPSQAVPGLELLAPGQEEASAFLQTLDCCFYRTSPVLRETAGRTVAEAMACGVPVVCAEIVGCAELVTSGVDGFVFDADDDEAALRHLTALREDVALCRRMGAAARAKAEASFGVALHDEIRTAFLGPCK